ncbi:MAG: hypothetical protein JKY94_08035 [Rhodobacteraceae bacterium]|nr:hypothetical protein [Paracoccaceae bacterium]
MSDPILTNKFMLLLGDGAASETFAWPCGANARSVSFTNNTGEEVLLDCSDPVGVTPAMNRWTESQDTSLNISGRVAKESISMWRDWADSGDVKNMQIRIDEVLSDGGGYWTVPAILQGFELGAEGKATATLTATIVGAGRRVWTDAAA